MIGQFCEIVGAHPCSVPRNDVAVCTHTNRKAVYRYGEILVTNCSALLEAADTDASKDTVPKEKNKGNETREFNSVPITGGREDLIYMVGHLPSINKTWDCNDSQKSITLAYSCECSSCDKKGVEIIMKKLLQWYNNSSLDFVTHPFVHLDTMKETLFSDLDSNYDGCPKFIGGIYFSKIHKEVPEWNKEGISEFWQDGGPDASQKDIDDIPSEPNYWKSGFLSLQYAIEKAFIELVRGNVSLSNVEVHLLRMPILPTDSTLNIILLLSVLLFLIVLISALSMLKDIALERDSWIMKYMSVMGLNQLSFYISHFLIAALKMLPFAVTFSAICANKYLEYTSSSLYICVVILFCITTLVLALFLGILFKKFTQIGPFVVLVILAVLPWKYPPDINDVPLCVLESFNPLYAINIAVKFFLRSEYRLQKTGWLSIFKKDQFLLGIVFLMLLFDAFVFSLLAFYIAMVMPTKGASKHHPLFFLWFFGFKTFSMRKSALEDEIDQRDSEDPDNGNVEPLSATDESDIVVNKIFKALRGQITVLLGRNGAGKSTTFSVLTGMINYDSGQVLICGDDLRKGLRKCQDNLGFCPQYNPLFDHLTINEHLQFYAGMKSGRLNGPHGKNALGQEIQRVAGELGIETLLNMQARKLNGGQKRKLCVAIALIANSRVVLLDEPSAGMDPEARHEFGQMLEKIKHDRTILLTTHYMEEANTLGDRIMIIVNGRLVCNGSPQFLKNRFGIGYLLTVVLNIGSMKRMNVQKFFDAAIAAIFAVILKHLPSAYIGNAQNFPEFSVILPTKYQKHYANLFEELEQMKGDQQPIKSFDLSLNTLEQVFLRVNDLADTAVYADGTDSMDGPMELADDLFGLRQQQILKSFLDLIRLWIKQIAAILCRQLLWALRNPFDSFGNYVERSLSPYAANQYFSIQLKFAESSQYQNNFNELATKIPYRTTYENYPLVIGASEHKNHSKIQLVAHFSGVARHSAPMALSFVTNALLGKDFVIYPKIAIYDIADKNREENLLRVSNFIAVISIACIFSCMPCFLLKSLVDDRSTCFKHQLLLTRLHPFTYWTSITIWHSIIYILFCLGISIPIFVFGLLDQFRLHFFLLCFLFFWSYHPLICCASFLFDESKSVTTTLFWIILLNIIVGVIFVYLTIWKTLPELLFIIYYLLPTTGFIVGLFNLTHALIGHNVEADITSKDILLYNLIYMPISGALFWLLLFCLQSRWMARKWKQLTFPLFHRTLYQRLHSRDLVETDDDEDIRKEREFVKQHGIEEFALFVNGLTKYYGSYPAVDGITFGVPRKQCFGLLGVNGAGKTTTFQILSGTKLATSGRATICDGNDVSRRPPIGYCPQFDALPMELTGREVLTLVARLNGFFDVSAKVQTILHCIQMDDQADKLIRYNSGGQRRRISFGLALLARSNFIMLDEPTTGIDPSTRRYVWRLIHAIRQQSIAILLSSHSVDECEALCNRIAFMNKGKLIGIGSNRHLKTRYGQSYKLTITVSNPNDRVFKFLKKCVFMLFEGIATVDLPSGNVYEWELPKRDTVCWTKTYRGVQELADKYPENANLPPGSDRPKIIVFSLTQNSLEQVFLHLSRLHEATPNATPEKLLKRKEWGESKM
uniref:ABC transporter domain-containing protein n=1 Tax=Globodera rostochiensis TaxID=31243 RepID=A0A914H1R2_GLORO